MLDQTSSITSRYLRNIFTCYDSLADPGGSLVLSKNKCNELICIVGLIIWKDVIPCRDIIFACGGLRRIHFTWSINYRSFSESLGE